jgi:hypothetical protein
VFGAWVSLFLGVGIANADPAIPVADWKVWAMGATWIVIVYVGGSLLPVLRAARAEIMPGLGSAPSS